MRRLVVRHRVEGRVALRGLDLRHDVLAVRRHEPHLDSPGWRASIWSASQRCGADRAPGYVDDHQLARILCRYRLQTAEGGRRTGAEQVKSVPSTNIHAEFSRNEVSMGLHARRLKPGKAKQGRTGSSVGRSVCGGPDRWGKLRSGRIERSANPLISGSRRRYGGEQHDEKPARTRLPPGAAPPFGRAAGKPRGARQAGHLYRCERRIHGNDACIDLQSMQEVLRLFLPIYVAGVACGSCRDLRCIDRPSLELLRNEMVYSVHDQGLQSCLKQAQRKTSTALPWKKASGSSFWIVAFPVSERNPPFRTED